MTLKELMEVIGEGNYLEDTLVLVNGKPANDVSFGLMIETGQMAINILSYETH